MIINQPTSKFFSPQNFGKRKRGPAPATNSQPKKKQKMKSAQMRRMTGKMMSTYPQVSPLDIRQIGIQEAPTKFQSKWALILAGTENMAYPRSINTNCLSVYRILRNNKKLFR